MDSIMYDKIKIKNVIKDVASNVIVVSNSRGKYTQIYINGKKTLYVLLTKGKTSIILKLNDSIKGIKDKVSNELLTKIKESLIIQQDIIESNKENVEEQNKQIKSRCICWEISMDEFNKDMSTICEWSQLLKREVNEVTVGLINFEDCCGICDITLIDELKIINLTTKDYCLARYLFASEDTANPHLKILKGLFLSNECDINSAYGCNFIYKDINTMSQRKTRCGNDYNLKIITELTEFCPFIIDFTGQFNPLRLESNFNKLAETPLFFDIYSYKNLTINGGTITSNTGEQTKTYFTTRKRVSETFKFKTVKPHFMLITKMLYALLFPEYFGVDSNTYKINNQGNDVLLSQVEYDYYSIVNPSIVKDAIIVGNGMCNLPDNLIRLVTASDSEFNVAKETLKSLSLVNIQGECSARKELKDRLNEFGYYA